MHTVVPCPGCDRTSHTPPSTAARSLMVCRPMPCSLRSASAAARSARSKPRPLSLHGQGQHVGVEAPADVDAVRAGVTDRVRQRLATDQVQALFQRRAAAGDRPRNPGGCSASAARARPRTAAARPRAPSASRRRRRRAMPSPRHRRQTESGRSSRNSARISENASRASSSMRRARRSPSAGSRRHADTSDCDIRLIEDNAWLTASCRSRASRCRSRITAACRASEVSRAFLIATARWSAMIWMLATSSSSNGFEPFEVDAAEHFVAEHDRHRELGAHVDRHRRRDVARILAHVVDDLHLAASSRPRR